MLHLLLIRQRNNLHVPNNEVKRSRVAVNPICSSNCPLALGAYITLHHKLLCFLPKARIEVGALEVCNSL